MDERIKERRREVGRTRGRRRLTVALSVVALIVVAVGFVWVRSTDLFAVRYVSVPVSEHVSAEAMRTALRSASGVNLLRISTQDLEDSLGAIPWVRTVRVYRHFPDTLEVDIDEYTAVALVRDAEGVDWLLAEDGRVLQPVDAALPSGLPTIVPPGDVRTVGGSTVAPRVADGLPLAVALGQADLWPATAPPVDHIVVEPSGDLVLELQGGGQVRLGDATELDVKFMVAREIIDRYLKDGRDLEYVDVRVPSRPVAKAR